MSPARTKRRHINRHLTQTVIQVFAELTALDGVRKIHVCRRNHTDVRFLHFGRTDADEFARFGTRNKRTCRQGQFSNLIEKNGSAIRFFEIAFARFGGSRERPLFVAEQFAVDRAFRNGTAVDSDEWAVLAP